MSTYSYCGLNSKVDCNDVFSIIIFTLLSLKNPIGSTLEEITDTVSTICPSFTPTLDEMQTYLLAAYKQGVIVLGTPTTWTVNAAMARVNSQNRKYYCVGLFYKC